MYVANRMKSNKMKLHQIEQCKIELTELKALSNPIETHCGRKKSKNLQNSVILYVKFS
jgi:hypothetical protein